MSRVREIEQRAAEWLVRRDQLEWHADDEAALGRWLADDRAHVTAFWRLEHGWSRADRLAALSGESTPRWLPAHSFPVAARWACAAGIAAIIATAILYLARPFAGPSPTVQRVATAVGGRREVSLPDGSRVTVNTDSVMRAAVGRASRDVWLDRGEAYFEVAHDARHPFVIRAGDERITVLGTRFSVRREAGTVRVAVAEGRVRVDHAGDGSGSASIVTAGDVAVARGASLLVTGRSTEAIDNALAWRHGKLAFDQTMLGDAAADFNRYNTVQIHIADEAAARIRIGGSFDADNARAFARLLHGAFGLEVREDGEKIVISS